MKKAFLLICMIFVITGAKRSEFPSMSGVWIQTNQMLVGRTIETKVKVIAKGKLFRIKKTVANIETIDIYDGKMFHSKTSIYKDTVNADLSSKPIVNSAELDKKVIDDMRFWDRPIKGSPIPGKKILGRKTVLYKVKTEIDEGVATYENWVDKKTGVTLKSILTMQAYPLDQTEVMKMTWECQNFKLSPVDKSTFKKPQ